MEWQIMSTNDPRKSIFSEENVNNWLKSNDYVPF